MTRRRSTLGAAPYIADRTSGCRSVIWYGDGDEPERRPRRAPGSAPRAADDLEDSREPQRVVGGRHQQQPRRVAERRRARSRKTRSTVPVTGSCPAGDEPPASWSAESARGTSTSASGFPPVLASSWAATSADTSPPVCSRSSSVPGGQVETRRLRSAARRRRRSARRHTERRTPVPRVRPASRAPRTAARPPKRRRASARRRRPQPPAGFGGLREQAERAEEDQKPVAGRRRLHLLTERDPQRVRLRCREVGRPAAAEDAAAAAAPRTQAAPPTRCPGCAAPSWPRGAASRSRQQHGLAGARLAEHHQRATRTGPRSLEQLRRPGLLPRAADHHAATLRRAGSAVEVGEEGLDAGA